MRMSRRLMPGLVVVALAVLAVPARAVDGDQYLPNDATMVVSINVKQILDSALFKNYEPKIKEALKGNDEAKKVLEELGLDPFKDVTSVLIGGNGSKAEEQAGLIVITGKYDKSKIEAAVKKAIDAKKGDVKIIQEGGYTLYESEGKNEKNYFAILDNTTIVAGPKKDLIVDALDKKAGKKKSELKGDLKTLLNKIDAKQSVSIVALPDGLAGQAAEFADKVKNLTGGITVSDEIKLELVLAAKSDKKAEELAETLKDGLGQAKAFAGLIAAQQKAAAPLIDVLGTVKVANQASDVTLKAQVSKDVIAKLEKAIKEAQKGQ